MCAVSITANALSLYAYTNPYTCGSSPISWTNYAGVITYPTMGTYASAGIQADRNLDPYWMAVRPRLFSSAGDLVLDAGWYYNDSLCAGMGRLTNVTSTIGSYKSFGLTYEFDGEGYWLHSTPYTGVVTYYG